NAILALRFEVSLQDLRGGWRYDEKISALAKSNGRRLAVDGHVGFEPLEKRDSEIRKRDVLRQREQAPDAARRARCRCELVGRIALDDRDRAGAARMAPQEIGGGEADDAAANDRNIGTHRIRLAFIGIRAMRVQWIASIINAFYTIARARSRLGKWTP